MVKIVDARRSATTRGGFVGAVLLADANMKRDLEVNDLETSETRWRRKARGRKMMEENGRRIPLLPLPHFWSNPKMPFIARSAASIHSSFVHLSFPQPKLVGYQLL
jgi:hypothetical protein